MNRFYVCIEDVDFGAFKELRGEPHQMVCSERSKMNKFINNGSKSEIRKEMFPLKN